MRGRRLWWLLLTLAVLAVIASAEAVALWPRPHAITRANFDRIRTGMSRLEVEAILGPPGDYRTGHGETGYGRTYDIGWAPDPPTDLADSLAEWRRIPGQAPEDAHQWAGWLSDSFGITIAIDESESVVQKVGCLRRTTEGPLENLLWRAKRQWRRWFQ